MRVILKGADMIARLAEWRKSALDAEIARTATQKRRASAFRLDGAPAHFGYIRRNGRVRLLPFAATYGHVLPKEWLEISEGTLQAIEHCGLARITSDRDFPSSGTIYLAGTQTATERGFMVLLADFCALVADHESVAAAI